MEKSIEDGGEAKETKENPIINSPIVSKRRKVCCSLSSAVPSTITIAFTREEEEACKVLSRRKVINSVAYAWPRPLRLLTLPQLLFPSVCLFYARRNERNPLDPFQFGSKQTDLDKIPTLPIVHWANVFERPVLEPERR